MPNRRISELELVTAPTVSDTFPIVSSGVTKKTSIGNLLNSGLPISASSVSVNGQPVMVGQLSWARYDDTQYTTSSAYSLTVAAGEQPLPNNGGYRVETHLHSSVPFYNSGSNTIRVENEGDVYMCTVTFRAKSANASAAYMRLQLDSTTGTPYERVGKDLSFIRGNNVWHSFHEVFQYYADADFVTNGNRWNIQAFEATIDIANVIFFIQRTQNHKS
jgi:hypothetical protein